MRGILQTTVRTLCWYTSLQQEISWRRRYLAGLHNGNAWAFRRPSGVVPSLSVFCPNGLLTLMTHSETQTLYKVVGMSFTDQPPIEALIFSTSSIWFFSKKRQLLLLYDTGNLFFFDLPTYWDRWLNYSITWGNLTQYTLMSYCRPYRLLCSWGGYPDLRPKHLQQLFERPLHRFCPFFLVFHVCLDH